MKPRPRNKREKVVKKPALVITLFISFILFNLNLNCVDNLQS
jgi:hypothetical protein